MLEVFGSPYGLSSDHRPLYNNKMKQVKRYELSEFKRLRIDKANCCKIKMTPWNRIKFLFKIEATIKYVEIFDGVQSGWAEK